MLNLSLFSEEQKKSGQKNDKCIHWPNGKLIDAMTRSVLSNELHTAKPARSGLQSKQFTGLLLTDNS